MQMCRWKFWVVLKFQNCRVEANLKGKLFFKLSILELNLCTQYACNLIPRYIKLLECLGEFFYYGNVFILCKLNVFIKDLYISFAGIFF